MREEERGRGIFISFDYASYLSSLISLWPAFPAFTFTIKFIYTIFGSKQPPKHPSPAKRRYTYHSLSSSINQPTLIQPSTPFPTYFCCTSHPGSAFRNSRVHVTTTLSHQLYAVVQFFYSLQDFGLEGGSAFLGIRFVAGDGGVNK